MSKGIIAGLCAFSFLFLYFSDISAVPLQLKVPGSKLVSCDYIDPMEGPIPNPFNCSEFYICRGADNTSYTIPDKMYCPLGFNKSTYWNIHTCSCEHENTGCYDESQHGPAEFFGCATLFVPTPTAKTSETPTTTQNSIEYA
ncbi:unnamed protein product [Orchesella dallaii]|uniref:Chitin-binding type-2 domain-containing protein n=1 Tax=Orchesella dallaii TaxID=48710 RepID=A0ABP1R8G7_9HEXA